MPQLVKGGKHAFGWSRVGDRGRITIPPEAVAEYRLHEFEQLILVPGSRTSGGFGVATPESLKKSHLEIPRDAHPGFEGSGMPEGSISEHKGKPYCRAVLRQGGFTLPVETLQRYGIGPGDRLLVIRGSGLAVGFAVRGPIVEEARKHPELEVFQPNCRFLAGNQWEEEPP